MLIVSDNGKAIQAASKVIKYVLSCSKMQKYFEGMYWYCMEV